MIYLNISDSRPKRPNLFVRILLMASLIFMIELPPIVLVPLRHYQHLNHAAATYLGLYLVTFLLIIVFAAGIYHRVDQRPHRSQRFGQRLKWVFGGYVAIMGGSYILSMLNRMIYHQTQTANNANIAHLMHNNPLGTAALAFSVVFLTPIAEELIFRGSAMNLFFKPSWVWAKVLFSCLIFGASHANSTPISFLIYAYLGAVLAIVYTFSGDIKNSMLLHGLNNAIALIPLLL